MRSKERWVITAICAGLIALVWFVFGQTVRFPFINFDDPEYVYEVPEINTGLTLHNMKWAFATVPSPSWCPLTNISHMAEFSLFGANAGAFHAVNVLLHTISVLLLFLLLLRMTGATWRSAFVAAIFAIHPLRAESVAWVIERKDVLSGVFFMLTLWAYLIYTRKPGPLRYCLVCVVFACGLMSKPMLVTTPVVLLLLDYWPLERWQRAWSMEQGAKVISTSQQLNTSTSAGRLILEKIPLLVLSALSCLATIVTQTVAESSYVPPSLISRIKNAFVSLITYIYETFWPIDLSVFYPHPRDQINNWLVLFAVLLVLGMTALAVIVRRKHPYVFVGWFWYLVMISPVIGIVQAGRQAHADRFTYLPQIGLLIAISWTVAGLLKMPKAERGVLISRLGVGRWALGVFCCAILFALALAARAQTGYWRDSEVLWSHAIAVTKNNGFAHASLADLLLRRGRLDDAIVHCQEALKIDPRDADAHNNLGLALLQKGRESEAAAEFRKSLEIDPHQMNAAPNLAWILATSSDAAVRNGAKAVELAEGVLQHSGHPNAIVLRTLAAAYAENGRFADAINAAEQASQLATAQGNTGLAQDLQRCINNFRMGLPLRSNVGAQ